MKVLSILLFMSSAALAQQPDGTLELPEFIITGKENIDVPQAQRLSPRAMSAIDSAQLEHFRVIDRELTELMPRAPRPSPIPPGKIFRGNAFAGAGRFSQPLAGLEFGSNVGILDAHARGAYIREAAYDPNTERSFGFASGTIGVSIPENIFFFGRGRLSMNVEGDGRKDNLLYRGALSADARTMSSFYLAPQFDGLFNGVRYNAAVRLGAAKLGDDSVSEKENLFRIRLYAEKKFETFAVGFSFLDERRTLDQNGSLKMLPTRDYGFFHVGGSVGLSAGEKFRSHAKIFFAEVGDLYHDRSQYILPEVGVLYSVDPHTSFSLDIGSRATPVHAQDLLRGARMIPVNHLYSEVDVENFFVAAGLNLEPLDNSLRIHTSLTFSSYARKATWFTARPDSGAQVFTADLVPTSDDARRIEFAGDAMYAITLSDRIDADILLTHQLDQATEMYLPFVRTHATFTHSFAFPFTTAVSADYRSPTDSVAGRILFGAEGDYQLFENVSAFLRLTNLLSTKYQEWIGYNEPPLGVVVGIRARW